MLFVGDDWAEDHHDVEIVDDTGQVLARRRLPEGLDGVTRLHALIGEHTPIEWADLEPDRAAAMVKVGIETDRGPWVAALAAASAATHGPRSVSTPTLTMAAARSGSRSAHSIGVCSPIRACSRVTPSRPSGSRLRASSRPVSSTISTS